MKLEKFNAEVAANYGRHLSHAGKLWSASYQLTGTSLVMMLVTGALQVQAMFRIAMSQGGSVVITEALAAGTPGTNLPFSNYNRCEPGRKFLSTLSVTPTGTSGGTALPTDYVPPVSQGNKQMSVMEDAVYTLLPNTKYLITLTPASSSLIQFDIDAYEET